MSGKKGKTNLRGAITSSTNSEGKGVGERTRGGFSVMKKILIIKR